MKKLALLTLLIFLGCCENPNPTVSYDVEIIYQNGDIEQLRIPAQGGCRFYLSEGCLEKEATNSSCSVRCGVRNYIIKKVNKQNDK